MPLTSDAPSRSNLTVMFYGFNSSNPTMMMLSGDRKMGKVNLILSTSSIILSIMTKMASLLMYPALHRLLNYDGHYLRVVYSASIR